MIIFAILLAYGLANIIVQGSIFDGLKTKLMIVAGKTKYSLIKWLLTKFLQLINCPKCIGFQIGWFIGLYYGPFSDPFISILFNGAFYSGTTWIIWTLVQYLGNGYDPARTINVIVQNESQIGVKVINTDSKKVLNG